MRISLIVAMDRHGTIGRDNALPWHLPADLAHFRRLTLGKPIIMGRKTFQSIGRPLPDRRNIVVSRDRDLLAPGCVVVNSLCAALIAAEAGAPHTNEDAEVMIIGGTTLFAATLPIATTLFRTLVESEVEGDVRFPDWPLSEWELITEETRRSDERNRFDLRFQQWRRRAPARGDAS